MNSTNDYPSSPFPPFSSFIIYLFITYLAALGLSGSMWDLQSSSTCRIFSCDKWHQVPWPGIKLKPPELGVWSLSPWTTRDVPFFLSKWIIFFSLQLSSVTQSCLTLCDPMNCSTPGLPVHHQLLEFTQTHVHQVGDAIQSSHPLSSPSPPAPNPFQHQSRFQWDNSSHQVAKVIFFYIGLIDGLLDACEIISDNQYQIIKIRVYKIEGKTENCLSLMIDLVSLIFHSKSV